MKFHLPCLAFTIILIAILIPACKTPSILVTEEQRQGDYYNNLYDYNQAILHYENMLAASLKLGIYRNLDMEADVCRKIANAHNVQGEYERALEYMNRALEMDSAQDNTIEIIEDYRELGKIHLYMGEFPEGIEYLNHALSLNEGMDQSLKGINQLSIADTYLTLARLHTVLGDFKEGELYGLSALKIYRNLDHPEGEMESLLQLGKISIQYGSGDSGETYVRMSLKLARDLSLNTYRHKEVLARLSENRALYEEALRLKLEAVEEAKISRNLPQIIWAHMLIGDLYRIMGDQQNARDYYQVSMSYLDSSQIRASALDASANLRAGDIDQAYAYFSAAGSEVAAGIAGLRLGEVALEWKMWQEALDHLQRSLGHFSAAGLADGRARALTLMAISNLGMNNLLEAHKNLVSAEEHAVYDETRWRMLFALGNLYEALSKPDSAITAYRSSVEIIEGIRGNLTIEEYKSMYLEDKMEVYDRLIRLLMENGKSNESFFYSERARARSFLDMLGNSRIHVRQDESSALVELEQKLRQEIQSLSRLKQKGEMALTRGFSQSQLEQEIYDTREEYNDVLRRLKLYNQEYSSMINLETANIPDLLSEIGPATAFLVYWVSQDDLYIWMVTSGGILGRSVSVGEEEINDLVMKGRETVGSRQHIGIYSLCYKYLVKPLEEELKPYKTIGIVPHLPLHFLPYQCLMPDMSSYLIDHFNIFYAPSVNAFALASNKALTPEKEFFAMALGGLELGGLSGLPGTTREVSHISTLFSEPTVAYERSSTESFFKSSVTPFEFVHLATHGILDQHQPMYSYLLLAPTEEDDGLLTVNEIFGLNMNARLVVLSACETALGSLNRGDEIIGLSRAFLYAGSRDVIVSLWSVADEPTAYLMTQFYTNLANQNPVQSLRLAQIAAKQKYKSPVYWAPFQLIGTGD